MKAKTEQFEVGYSIYQVADGSFRVYRLDDKGKRVSMVENGEEGMGINAWEFYANAVCALIKDLIKD
jgi:hypothetical protein